MSSALTFHVALQHLGQLPVHDDVLAGLPVALVGEHEGWVQDQSVQLDPQQVVHARNRRRLAQHPLDEGYSSELVLHPGNRV